jgi:hypothetical protein
MLFLSSWVSPRGSFSITFFSIAPPLGAEVLPSKHSEVRNPGSTSADGAAQHDLHLLTSAVPVTHAKHRAPVWKREFVPVATTGQSGGSSLDDMQIRDGRHFSVVVVGGGQAARTTFRWWKVFARRNWMQGSG